MPLNEESQCEWKRRLVRDALERLAGIADPAVETVLRPSAPLGYRNRVEFSAGVGLDGRVAIGLWGEADGRRGLIDIPVCPLQTVEANAVLGRIRDFVGRRQDVANELIAHGPFRILLRTTSGGSTLVGLWGTRRAFPGAEDLAAELATPSGGVDSVVRLTARPGRRGGVRCEALHGAANLVERLGDLTFELPAASFMQVNPVGGNALIRLVVDLAGPVKNRGLLDLFGGTGVFGLHLARAGARPVTVCDADRDAIAAGAIAARAAGLKHVRFVHATVGAYLRSGDLETPELVVANPPRRGFGRGIAAAILTLEPRKVVLVSCDPPTLARDLKPFLAAGYRPQRIVPIDLFPQTHHIETVVLLVKRGPRRGVKSLL